MNTSTRSHSSKIVGGLALITALGLALVGCSAPSSTGESDGAGDSSNTVTLIVHDSFPNEEFAAAASEATGYDVEVVSAGDGGELSAQLVLTKGAPLADAFFGIDNSFAARIVDNGVADPLLTAGELPSSAQTDAVFDLPASGSEPVSRGAGVFLAPITRGATCMNIDPAWFAEQGLAEPVSYDDLADPAYKGLTVLLDPTSSSTGASFLVGTVAKFGEEGFADYWQGLAANEPRIAQGWDEAYYTHFTQADGGTYPIVLSYGSSPAYTVNDEGTESVTKALLDTCSSQIEYAGVLEGAANPEGAKAVVEYMLSREFQDTIADTMYMYPVDSDAYLPEEWAEFAPLPSAPNDMTPAAIGAGLENWLKTWSDVTGW